MVLFLNQKSTNLVVKITVLWRSIVQVSIAVCLLCRMTDLMFKNINHITKLTILCAIVYSDFIWKHAKNDFLTNISSSDCS